MNLVNLFRRWNEPQLDRLVDRIAHRSEAAVWQRVRGRVESLPRHQALGYIRARGGLVWDREMAIAEAEEPRLMQRHRDVVDAAVRQRVVARLLAYSRRSVQDSVRRAA